MGYCASCDSHNKELLRTVYGDYICEDCWDDYICSDVGMVEYMISIIKGECPVEEFDADFLGKAAVSWQRNYDMFDLSPEELTSLKSKAIELGLL